RCTTFVISDFIDSHDYYKQLSLATNKHDIMAIQVYDKRDTSLPDIGLMRVQDLETGATRWIDTSSKNTRRIYGKWWYERQQMLMDNLRRLRIDHTSIATDEDFSRALMTLLQGRGTR
ncbi:MAG: DUF58 domain-containing protein, partial [Duncaniella sp.]|nr:DUF58 domain-containing protein [Duncaniella sp.]